MFEASAYPVLSIIFIIVMSASPAMLQSMVVVIHVHLLIVLIVLAMLVPV